MMTALKTNPHLATSAIVAALLSASLASSGSAATIATAPARHVAAPNAETTETNDSRDDLAQLLAVEDAAEAVAEGEASGARAVRTARRAVVRWPMVRRSLRQNGATTDELAAVDRTIAALRIDLGSRADLARGANDVTGTLAPLFAVAGDHVPAGVHELDYVGRSIELDVRGGDWTRARHDVRTLQSGWTAVRAHVAGRPGGAAPTAAFDRAVRAVASGVTARSATNALAATTQIGDAVDSVEKVY